MYAYIERMANREAQRTERFCSRQKRTEIQSQINRLLLLLFFLC